MRKIKIVCRPEQKSFTRQLFVDGEEKPEAFDAEARSAGHFFDLFAPAEMMQRYTAQYGKHFVLVFRTDDVQMQEFEALLQEHGSVLG
ncbi:MAG: hypothetical protein E7511_06275 [Ruminococcus sp.]|nr:hypothetical protein [Ruminococcus sp.]